MACDGKAWIGCKWCQWARKGDRVHKWHRNKTPGLPEMPPTQWDAQDLPKSKHWRLLAPMAHKLCLAGSLNHLHSQFCWEVTVVWGKPWCKTSGCLMMLQASWILWQSWCYAGLEEVEKHVYCGFLQVQLLFEVLSLWWGQRTGPLVYWTCWNYPRATMDHCYQSCSWCRHWGCGVRYLAVSLR